jgi:hypothetical protein
MGCDSSLISQLSLPPLTLSPLQKPQHAESWQQGLE